MSQEELQQVFDSVAPTYKIRGDKTAQVQVLRDQLRWCAERNRILLGCMALQGCRTIEVHRANLGDIRALGSEYYLRLDGKNSIRTAMLREDLAKEIVLYRQARKITKEKLNPASPLFISLSNRRYGQRLSRSGIDHVVDSYLEKCDLKHTDLVGL